MCCFIGILNQLEFKTVVKIVSESVGNYKERENKRDRKRVREIEKVNSFASKYTYN